MRVTHVYKDKTTGHCLIPFFNSFIILCAIAVAYDFFSKLLLIIGIAVAVILFIYIISKIIQLLNHKPVDSDDEKGLSTGSYKYPYTEETDHMPTYSPQEIIDMQLQINDLKNKLTSYNTGASQPDPSSINDEENATQEQAAVVTVSCENNTTQKQLDDLQKTVDRLTNQLKAKEAENAKLKADATLKYAKMCNAYMDHQDEMNQYISNNTK